MDDDLLTFLGEAAVELRLPPEDPSAGVAAKAMLAVEHRSISQVLAWDLGRLKNGTGLVDRADKLAYVTMLKGPDGDRLGDSPVAANLVGLVVDRVALSCKEPTAAVSVATGH